MNIFVNKKMATNKGEIFNCRQTIMVLSTLFFMFEVLTH